MNENTILDWISQANYTVMAWMEMGYWPVLAAVFFFCSACGMTPITSKPDHPFITVAMIKLRRLSIWIVFAFAALPFITMYIYDASIERQKIGANAAVYSIWFLGLAQRQFWILVVATVAGFICRFFVYRYVVTWWSGIMRKLRRRQTDESLSDIRNEVGSFKPKDFTPSKYYEEGGMFTGLDTDNKPVYIDRNVFIETNMQVIGPTRYGKGVVMGNLIDQGIEYGDLVVYIEPKPEKFMPHIMKNKAEELGRKFIFIDLNDGDISRWSPFEGGTYNDGLNRLFMALGLEYSGDPGTDYYKSQEHKILIDCFKKTRSIRGLHNELSNMDNSKAEAVLYLWKELDALNPARAGRGVSIEKAILDNAIVYVRGSMRDQAVKTATKAFIVEFIQEAIRLYPERKNQITMYVDEVKFLASKELSNSLATSLGFDLNMVLAYQAINDIRQPDDITLDGEAFFSSVNTNCQLKNMYGGADAETAEWIEKLSGTVKRTVTQREQTEILEAGAEVFDKGRTLADTEEALIPANILLTLPPRVGILFRPTKLATVNFSCFVPVETTEHLDNYISSKKPKDKKDTFIPHAEQEKPTGKKKKAKKIVDASKGQKTEAKKPKQENEQKKIASAPLEDNANDAAETTESDTKSSKNKARKERQKAKKSHSEEQPKPAGLDVLAMIDEIESDIKNKE